MTVLSFERSRHRSLLGASRWLLRCARSIAFLVFEAVSPVSSVLCPEPWARINHFLFASVCIPVHQASLLGSVFSNMLLVLGCCFFFGGIYYPEQRFNSTSAIANMSLLLLSSLALVLPTPLSHAAVSEKKGKGRKL